MPCNPSIGGSAKGQIVGEIDALGGEMGRAADATFLQMKVLNRSRGPSVQCLRAQSDRDDYVSYMLKVVDNQDRLTVFESPVRSLLFSDDLSNVIGVRLDNHECVYSKSVIITTGHF